MPWTTHLLVVANRTAESGDLVSYLRDRAKSGPLRVTLRMPVEVERRDAARARLQTAIEGLRAAGIDSHGSLAEDGDPLHAAMDAYDPARHDEILVVTLPANLSRWLGCDVPQRVARATGALVRHVETRESPAPLRR
jgi:hypothetical protein